MTKSTYAKNNGETDFCVVFCGSVVNVFNETTVSNILNRANDGI
jgi:hypothetical protein